MKKYRNGAVALMTTAVLTTVGMISLAPAQTSDVVSAESIDLLYPVFDPFRTGVDFGGGARDERLQGYVEIPSGVARSWPGMPGMAVGRPVQDLAFLPTQLNPVSGATEIKTEVPNLTGTMADADDLSPFLVPAIDTVDVMEEVFPTLRRSAIEATQVPDAGAEAFIELARIMLGGALNHEAASITARVHRDYPQMTAELRAKNSGIALAATLLGGTDTTAVADIADMRWADGALWPILARIRSADPELSAGEIRTAAASLNSQSKAVISQIIPMIFNAALALRDAELAAGILGAATRDPDFKSSSRYHYMTGLLRNLEGDEKAAFEAFASGMEFNDEWGGRARIAFSDIAIGRQDERLLDGIKEILTTGTEQWRGDDISLQMMIRLAGVAEEQADAPVALRVMSRIIAEHPDTREANLAKERIPVVLTAFSQSADKGDTDLRSFISVLRELESELASFEEWFEARRVLADLLSQEGLHAASAAEYRALRIGGSLGSLFERADNEARTAILEAEQEAIAGNDAAARKALSGSAPASDADLETKRLALSTRVRGDLLRSEAPESLASEVVLEVARAEFEAGSQQRALEMYEEFISRGQSLSSGDVGRYLQAKAIHAKKENPEENAEALRHENREALGQAARALSHEMPDIDRLSTETAKTMIDRAASAVEAARAISSGEISRETLETQPPTGN